MSRSCIHRLGHPTPVTDLSLDTSNIPEHGVRVCQIPVDARPLSEVELNEGENSMSRFSQYLFIASMDVAPERESDVPAGVYRIGT